VKLCSNDGFLIIKSALLNKKIKKLIKSKRMIITIIDYTEYLKINTLIYVKFDRIKVIQLLY